MTYATGRQARRDVERRAARDTVAKRRAVDRRGEVVRLPQRVERAVEHADVRRDCRVRRGGDRRIEQVRSRAAAATPSVGYAFAVDDGEASCRCQTTGVTVVASSDEKETPNVQRDRAATDESRHVERRTERRDVEARDETVEHAVEVVDDEALDDVLSASRSEPCASGTTMLLMIQPSTPLKLVVIVPTEALDRAGPDSDVRFAVGERRVERQVDLDVRDVDPAGRVVRDARDLAVTRKLRWTLLSLAVAARPPLTSESETLFGPSKREELYRRPSCTSRRSRGTCTSASHSSGLSGFAASSALWTVSRRPWLLTIVWRSRRTS